MSEVRPNQLFRKQNAKLLPATFKKGTISSVNSGARTVDVFFTENPQTVVRNIPLANSIDPTSLVAGMQVRVDTFSETGSNGMVVSYIIGSSGFISTTLRPVEPPTTSTSNGLKGQISWDSNYFYLAIGNNSWKRASLSSF